MSKIKNKNILIIAGEVSGDLHAAALVKELKTLDSDIKLFGIGGEKMKEAGVEIIYHLNKMAFMGFAEVVKHLPFIRKVKSDILNEVEKRKTKYAVLIDYPGFNLNIAKKLKANEVDIIYYISPQIWAWGSGRIKKIRALIKKMLVVFPFEEKLYKENNIDAAFVGHPLIERLNQYSFLSKDELKQKFNLDQSKEILLILPGSRNHEIEEIFPETIKAASRLADEFNLQVVVACSANLDEELFEKYKEHHRFNLIRGFTYDFLKNAKFGIIKSGTSTLEAGLMQLPMIIVYKTSGITYRIGKFLVKVKNIGMANIILNENVVPELVQGDVNSDKIYNESKRILSDGSLYEKMRSKLGEIRKKLGEKNASANAAKAIYNLINEA
ncbi:MAG: lipid-A-disaccharide synthase [Ignavibacteriaceae bacterium]|nr:lipid-A-disaccharide synthase [Ignavibacteriaceae bacterium]